MTAPATPHHSRYDPRKLRFVIQLSRDNGKTWESTCQSMDDGKLAMLASQLYSRTHPEFKWRYLDTTAPLNLQAPNPKQP
jgi:hypothetical protein